MTAIRPQLRWGTDDRARPALRPMRLARHVSSILGLLLVAGCGGPGHSGVEHRPARTQQAQPTPQLPTIARVRSCLTNAGLRFLGSSVPYAKAGGEATAPATLNLQGVPFLGFAVWPSQHYAWIYVALSQQAADSGQAQLNTYVRRYGATPSRYVRRRNNVLVLLDERNQPSPPEATLVDTCATA